MPALECPLLIVHTKCLENTHEERTHLSISAFTSFVVKNLWVHAFAVALRKFKVLLHRNTMWGADTYVSSYLILKNGDADREYPDSHHGWILNVMTYDLHWSTWEVQRLKDGQRMGLCIYLNLFRSKWQCVLHGVYKMTGLVPCVV